MSIQLTQEQLDSYRRDGFLVVEGLLEQDEVEGLRTRLREYTHGGRSQERLQVQIEPRVQRGELHVDAPGDGIRKIDGLVESDDRFHALGSNGNIVSVLEQIVGPDIKMFRNAGVVETAGSRFGQGHAPGFTILAYRAHGSLLLLVRVRRRYRGEWLHGGHSRQP